MSLKVKKARPDYLKALMSLRPKAKFKGGLVNGYSLETLAETYEGSDLPSKEECLAELSRLSEQTNKNSNIKVERLEERKYNPLAGLTLKEAEEYIDNTVSNIASAKTALKQILKLTLAKG